MEEEGDHVENQHESDVDDHNVMQEDVEELVEADDVSDNFHDEDDIDDYHFIETNNDDDDDNPLILIMLNLDQMIQMQTWIHMKTIVKCIEHHSK